MWEEDIALKAVPKHTCTCPLCSDNGQPLFQKESIWICTCPDCGHRFAALSPREDHVAAVYGDGYFFGGGAGYYDYLGDARLLRARGRCYARLLEQFMPVGEMLDVGAAAGFVLQGFVDSGWSGQGVEPNERMSAFARRELGLNVHTGTLEWFPCNQQYDLLTMIQVAAHFIDPRVAFQRAAELTRGGGFCLIETWNRESLTARLLGRRWHEYTPPSVLHWYSPDSLRRFLTEFGFREVARGRPKKRLHAQHIKSLLNYKLRSSRWGKLICGPLAILPGKLPIPYPAEDLFWSLFRKT